MHLSAAIEFVNHLASDTSPQGIDRFAEVCRSLGELILTTPDHDASPNVQRGRILEAAWGLGSTPIVRLLESRGFRSYWDDKHEDGLKP